MTAASTLRRFWDWKSRSLVLVVLLLTILGILVLLGGSTASRTWLRQLVWFMIGGGAAVLVVFFNYRSYIRYAYLFYGFILLALILTEVFGREVYGAKSWLVIPVIPSRLHLRFQPSEFANVSNYPPSDPNVVSKIDNGAGFEGCFMALGLSRNSGSFDFQTT